MCYEDISGTVFERMSVSFGRFSVRGPSRVADADGAFKGFRSAFFFKFRNLTFRLYAFDCLVRHNCHPRAVIAAVLHSRQTLKHDRERFTFSYIPNNAAHSYLRLMYRSYNRSNLLMLLFLSNVNDTLFRQLVVWQSCNKNRPCMKTHGPYCLHVDVWK